MQKINFQDLPSTSTPLNASTLNQMQDNIESAIEDVGGVIPTIENSLDSDSTTNGASVHATKLLNTYSTNELKIGTWIDGKPIYRKTIEYTGTINSETWTPITLSSLGINNTKDLFVKDGFLNFEGNIIEPFFSSNNRIQYLKSSASISFYLGVAPVKITLVLEYTKSTDPVG